MKTIRARKFKTFMIGGALLAAVQFIPSLSHAQNQCAQIFRKTENQLETEQQRDLARRYMTEHKIFKARFSTLARARNWFKDRNGKIEPKYRAERRRDLENLNWLLILGEAGALKDQVHSLIVGTEAAFDKAMYLETAIGRFKREIGTNPTEQQKTDLATLVARQSVELERFMAKFRDYDQVVQHLEYAHSTGQALDPGATIFRHQGAGNDVKINVADKDIPADKRIIQTASEVIETLDDYRHGEESRRERAIVEAFGGDTIPADRPKLTLMNKYYEYKASSSQARLARVRQEFWAEARTFIGRIVRVPQTMEAAQRAASHLPSPYRELAQSILASTYDRDMRDRHFPDIRSIIRQPSEGAGINTYTRLDRLMQIDTKSPGNHFLTTFARVTNGLHVWAELRNLAKERAGRTKLDKRFYQKMVQAEKDAARLGAISLLHEEADVDRWGRFVSTATAATYFTLYPQHLEYLNPAAYSPTQQAVMALTGLLPIGHAGVAAYRERREDAAAPQKPFENPNASAINRLQPREQPREEEKPEDVQVDFE